MTQAVTVGLVGKETASGKSGSGWTFRRAIMVSGISGSDAEVIANGLDAVDAVTGSTVPTFGDRHPIVTGLTVQEIVPRVIATDTVEYTISYGTPSAKSSQAEVGQLFVETGASLSMVEVDTDINGELMELQYDNGSFVQTKQVTASVGIATNRIVLRRREDFNPDYLADIYVGKINKTPFRHKAVGTVRCDSIVGQSSDGEITFMTTYSFTVKRIGGNYYGWASRQVFVDESGRMPANPDVVEGVGKKAFDVIETADFGELNLEGSADTRSTAETKLFI